MAKLNTTTTEYPYRRLLPVLTVVTVSILSALAILLLAKPDFLSAIAGLKPVGAGLLTQLVLLGCVVALAAINLLQLMLAPPVSNEKPTALPLPETSRRVPQLVEFETELRNNLMRTVALIKSHGEATKAYNACLEQAGRELIGMTTPDQLRLTIGFLLAENNKMHKVTSALQEDLQRSERQTLSLRVKLEQAEEVGRRDALTGLWNRRAFDQMLAEQITQVKEGAMAISLILADIDDFKQINDNFGHPIGDEVIRLVAEIIARNVKGRDIVARYGGEEFAVILPQTPLASARIVANQIRLQLENQRWKLSKRNEMIGRVTASMGVATLQPDETAESLVVRADTCLYEAKNAGRNRVES